MKTVSSRDNPTVKSLKLLLSNPRQQRDTGKTVLEGPHLLAAALERNIQPDLVAVSESARTHPEVTALLTRLAGTETLVLPDSLLRSMSELASPLGILARIAIPNNAVDPASAVPINGVGPANAVPPAPTLMPTNDCLLLDAVQDAGNVGALLRTAAAAGVSDILLGPGCAGAWTPRVLRAAQGAHFALTIREQVDLAAILSKHPGQSVAAIAHAGKSLYELDCTPPTAWLFGNEGAGIAPELVALTTRQVTIPLATGCESLNVAAAAAICLFEMRRQRLSS
jgi:TrmH family RNA methyltransferase